MHYLDLIITGAEIPSLACNCKCQSRVFTFLSVLRSLNAAISIDGRRTPHPFQEAEQAERRLVPRILPVFDEVVVLRYDASNSAPFPFKWVDAVTTETEYAASLLRISCEYEKRF